MAIFVNIDERAAGVIIVAAALVLWAILAPESFSSTVDTGMGIIEGAISGAQGAMG